MSTTLVLTSYNITSDLHTLLKFTDHTNISLVFMVDPGILFGNSFLISFIPEIEKYRDQTDHKLMKDCVEKIRKLVIVNRKRIKNIIVIRDNDINKLHRALKSTRTQFAILLKNKEIEFKRMDDYILSLGIHVLRAKD